MIILDNDPETDGDDDDEEDADLDKNDDIVMDQKKRETIPRKKNSKKNVSNNKKYNDLNDDEDYDGDDQEEDDDDYVDDNEEPTSGSKRSKSNIKKESQKKSTDITALLPELLPEKESQQYNNSKIIQCPSCPFGKGQIVCGTDNSTYSSMCRMEFHNCIHRTAVGFACFGFCPCLRVYEKVFIQPKNGGKFPAKGSSPTSGSGHNALKSQYYEKDSKFDEKIRIKMKKLSTNSVLPKKDTPKHRYQIAKNSECSTEQLRSMGLRLLDWFLVVMKEELKHRSKNPSADPTVEFKKWKKSISNANFTKLAAKSAAGNKKLITDLPDCEPQVSFMFYHFDTDQDFKLSVKELYYLEHDENEHCLEPYLTQCDEDRNQYLSAYEWCSCFSLKCKFCLRGSISKQS